MRVNRIEVDRTTNEAQNAQFAAVARGTVELPESASGAPHFAERMNPSSLICRQGGSR
jgi:hypothetical protein